MSNFFIRIIILGAITIFLILLLICFFGIIGIIGLGLIYNGFEPLGITLVVISVIGIICITLFVIWLIFGIHRLNLPLLGFGKFKNVPAIPFKLSEFPDTILSLLDKKKQRKMAVNGLSKTFTIGVGTAITQTAEAFSFMGMGDGDLDNNPLAGLALDSPDQYKMAWTTFDDIDVKATLNNQGENMWPNSLIDADEAAIQFWPMIAKYSIAYNLNILQRVKLDNSFFKDLLGTKWTLDMDDLWKAGNLFVIDMTIFDKVKSTTDSRGFTLFTPSTITFLRQTKLANEILYTPFSIQVSNGTDTILYTSGDAAWLYAIVAAKTSITVWGIWIGHVYKLHIVTAAMQMTMFKHLPKDHIVYQVLGRQSDFLVGFDQFFLLEWDNKIPFPNYSDYYISPPTSITNSEQYLELIDSFSARGNFFADDPITALSNTNLTEADFTITNPFDQFPVFSYYKNIFEITNKYVTAIINAYYPLAGDVASDRDLQKWIYYSSNEGNIKGLPSLNVNSFVDRTNLINVLTSLIYRVTVHGAARLNQVANTAMTFVPNFPPCLHRTDLPQKETPIVFNKILDLAAPANALSLNSFLPNTGTIGSLCKFLFTFGFTPPNIPFIPLEGTSSIEPPFTGSLAEKSTSNSALINYRNDLLVFMTKFANDLKVPLPPAQIHQWELNIEL